MTDKQIIPLALRGILDDIEKEAGESIFIGNMPEFDFIPFSSPQLNYLTRGGIPVGASTEIVGEEHSGKSTLAQDLIKNYQEYEAKRVEEKRKQLKEKLKEAKTKSAKTAVETELAETIERPAVYLDIEQTLNPRWLEKLGVDETKVIIYKPADVGIEVPLDNIIKMMETKAIGLVVIDSVGQMISTAEHETSIGKGNFGGASKSLTKYYKKAAPLYARNKIAHIVINQTREDLGGYNRLIRPGGKANQFAQSVVLRLRPTALYDDKYQVIPRHEALVHSRETTVNLIKNKMSGADRQTTQFNIRPNYGLDIPFDTLQQALIDGYIIKGGAWYTIFDVNTGEELTKVQGQARVLDFLEENPDYLTSLSEKLYELAIKDEEE